MLTVGQIGGFGISSNSISSSNNNLILRDNGEITGSTALLTGGKIDGWTISGTTLVGANATLDGALVLPYLNQMLVLIQTIVLL